jgi:hypothetical protein
MYSPSDAEPILIDKRCTHNPAGVVVALLFAGESRFHTMTRPYLDDFSGLLHGHPQGVAEVPAGCLAGFPPCHASYIRRIEEE